MNAPSKQALHAAVQFMMTHSVPRMTEETKQQILTERADRLAKIRAVVASR